MVQRKDIEALEKRVSTLRRILDELKKGVQRMAGDSLVFARNFTEDEWDIELHGITSPSYRNYYQVTLNVDDPANGVAQLLYDFEFDTPAQDMNFTVEQVRGDKYSWLVMIAHADYNSTSAGLSMKFYFFSTQRGTITITDLP